LAQPDLAASTRRSYQQTLDRLERALGREQPFATLTTNQVTAAVTAAWDGCAPATWNRHVATVRSFTGYCRRHRWLTDDLTAGLDRRVEPADRTKAIPLPQLEQLWRHDGIAVREKALWRFLYETAGRATEALSINVEDLDLDNKRVRVHSKGGDLDWLHFQTGSARLLPRLIAGRTHGPLFLADRAPSPARAPAAIDRCPETGRARLSYRRAEALSGRRRVDGPFISCATQPSPTWPSRTSAYRCSWPRAATPACARCSATPALEPRRSRRSPRQLIPPDDAVDLDRPTAHQTAPAQNRYRRGVADSRSMRASSSLVREKPQTSKLVVIRSGVTDLGITTTS
jgi:hypothetical protein